MTSLGRNIGFAIALFSFWAATATATEVKKLEKYEFFDAATVAADDACQRYAAIELGAKAEGVTEVGFPAPEFWNSLIKGFRLYAYNGVEITSANGNNLSDVICVVSMDQNLVVEIAFLFDGKGLAGFKSIAGKPRAESFRGMTVFQNPKPIKGSN